MFGYVLVNKPELKIKEFEAYRSWYCGLCRTLNKRHGLAGRLTLNYDMTFLIMILADLYDEKHECACARCIVHPLDKHCSARTEATDYCADMCVLLAYYKCRDDWKDEHKLKACFAMTVLSRKAKRVAERYPEKAAFIEKKMNMLDIVENAKNLPIDKVAKVFGEIMAEVFVYRDDFWKEEHKLKACFAMTVLSRKAKRVAERYPEKAAFIEKKMNMLDIVENAKNLPIDKVAKVFGEIMAEVFVYRDDFWKEDLYKLGFYLGKFIYLLDAYEDVEKDMKTGDYNPFKEFYAKPGFDDQVLNLLLLMIGEATDAFERLPLVENTEILRNILYSGVWVRYGKTKADKIKKESEKK